MRVAQREYSVVTFANCAGLPSHLLIILIKHSDIVVVILVVAAAVVNVMSEYI